MFKFGGFFTQTIAIITFAFLYFKTKGFKKGKGMSDWSNLKFFLLTLPLAIFVDYSNHLYITNSEKIISDFPYYKKLDQGLKDEFELCVVSLGPVGRFYCPKHFDGKKSLKVSTKQNLNERFRKCVFTKRYGYFKDENLELCLSAIRDYSKEESVVQKRVFDSIANKAKALSCSDKRDMYRLHEIEKLFPQLFRHHMLNQCLTDCKSYCYSIFIENRYEKELLEKYNKYFERFLPLKFNYDLKHSPAYYAVMFSFANIEMLLGKKRNTRLKKDEIRARFVLAFFYDHEFLDMLEKSIRELLSSEFPEFKDQFPFEIFKDKAFLKKNYEYYKKHPPVLQFDD